MSEEGSFGIEIAERFFGFLLLIIGVLAMYFTLTSANALGGFLGFFGFLSLVLLVLGIIMITVKIE